MTLESFADRLAPFVPEGFALEAAKTVFKPDLQLRIAKSRATKLGDYRPPQRGITYHKISVNHDLNRFAFLITLVHEAAHYECFKHYGMQVKPHGKEWKTIYRDLLEPFVTKGAFPRPIEAALQNYLKNPKAASCSDQNLNRALKAYDANPALHLEELEEGELFALNEKRIFRKGLKRRTRYLCTDQGNGRDYLVSGTAEVHRVTE